MITANEIHYAAGSREILRGVDFQVTEGEFVGLIGPNGSGKGTQGNLIKQKYNLAHIESGAIFREHIGGGTELGKKAKAYIDRGDLVPDDITIPMVLETLKTKGKDGWLLDGFPRNMVQAQKLWEALRKEGLKLDYVVEIPVSYTHLTLPTTPYV